MSHLALSRLSSASGAVRDGTGARAPREETSVRPVPRRLSRERMASR